MVENAILALLAENKLSLFMSILITGADLRRTSAFTTTNSIENPNKKNSRVFQILSSKEIPALFPFVPDFPMSS